jgi:Fe2+ transport system protein FeoA
MTLKSVKPGNRVIVQKLKGYNLSLRREEADMVVVDVLSPRLVPKIKLGNEN